MSKRITWLLVCFIYKMRGNRLWSISPIRWREFIWEPEGVCVHYRWKALLKGRFVWDTGDSLTSREFLFSVGISSGCFESQGYSPVNICWTTRSVMYTKYRGPVNIWWKPTFICCGRLYFPAWPYPHIHPILYWWQVESVFSRLETEWIFVTAFTDWIH